MPRVHTNEFPWHAPSDANRRENAVAAAKLMMNAAHTAPCAGGVDHVECELLWGEAEQEALAEKMEELSHLPGYERLQERYQTEAVMVREADCVLLIGDFRARNSPFDADCGLCGGPKGCSYVYSRRRAAMGQIDHTDKSLAKTPIDGPLCQLHIHDLGYNVGSALWAARSLMVDARPFMTVGVAASRLGYCGKSALVVGVCVAASAKNPFVDTHAKYAHMNMRRVVDSARRHYIITRQFGLDYRLNPGGKSLPPRDREEEEG
ncbi:MAG: hypothetical protein HY900_23070 [Deltaproteobacteria bacterium]|nr:hypothetical protein [Deltaproteobacteria bacterium]